jgi:hypothetical protein
MIYFRVIDPSKLGLSSNSTPAPAKSERATPEQTEVGEGENVRAVRAVNLSYNLG